MKSESLTDWLKEKRNTKNVYKMALAVNNVTMSCTSKPKEEPKQETVNMNKNTHYVDKNTHYVDFSNLNADKISFASTTTIKEETLEEAALKLFPKYISDPYNPNEDLNKEERNIWIDGAKSDTARDYWYAKLKQEIS